MHQYPNRPIYAYNIAMALLSTFEIDKESLATYYRETARIKDKRLYTSKRKKTDFFADLDEIRAKNISPLGTFTLNKMKKQVPKQKDEIDLNL